MTAQDRKTQILDATILLLAEQGLDGVTHRAVDQSAGLPQGSTSYYFSKKLPLLLAASEHLAGILEKDCDELQVAFSDLVAKEGMDAAVRFVADELVSFTDTSRHLFLARVELTLASARREDMAEVAARLTSAARRPLVFFLELISEQKSEGAVETCAGLIDGISLMYATGQGPKPTVDQISAVVRSVL